MITLTMSDGQEFMKDHRSAHLTIGSCTLFFPSTKRFRQGEGKKLFETVKRFVSSGDFEVILVSNASNALDFEEREDILIWLADHLKNNTECNLVLSGIDSAGCDGIL